MESMRIAMVMEFMASGSLYDVLRKPNELPWSLRLNLALDMASGLLYLHGQHIIHRDLKSLNILVDGQMRAKVSDFGLSKIKLTTASMTKGAGGTPHWMAPELFDEAANSEASDVYATGVVFWEIAARKLPYEGKNPSQLMRFVERGSRETTPDGTPSQFATLMTRCWSQRAEDRPSMHDVARDLRTMAASGTASPKPSPKAAVDSGGYAAFSRR
jgi:serine/threonine protein kinase